MWLETVCYLLDGFSLPSPGKADDDIQTLSCEKIVDQREVVELQKSSLQEEAILYSEDYSNDRNEVSSFGNSNQELYCFGS